MLRAALVSAALLLIVASDAFAIARGRAVTPGEAPWLVALRSNGTACGGVLVARDRVLTAAHCVQGLRPGALRLELGDGAVDDQTRDLRYDAVWFPPTYAVLPAPDFPEDGSRSASAHDLAVLRLATPVDDVAPVALASVPPAPGEAVTAYGRGRVGAAPRTVGPGERDPGTGPARPLAADQVVLAPDACRAEYATLLREPAHLCTADAGAARAQACAGDSGGPVIARRDGRADLVGLVTWGGETRGRDCGEGLPDVSERVAPHAAFIAAPPAAQAPYAVRATRVRRRGGILRCVSGPWRPASARVTVSWYRPGGRVRREIEPGLVTDVPGADRPLRGVHRTTIRARRTPLGCTVRAQTAGGWVEERSYNQR